MNNAKDAKDLPRNNFQIEIVGPVCPLEWGEMLVALTDFRIIHVLFVYPVYNQGENTRRQQAPYKQTNNLRVSCHINCRVIYREGAKVGIIIWLFNDYCDLWFYNLCYYDLCFYDLWYL